jgi:hypothetical protein
LSATGPKEDLIRRLEAIELDVRDSQFEKWTLESLRFELKKNTLEIAGDKDELIERAKKALRSTSTIKIPHSFQTHQTKPPHSPSLSSSCFLHPF